MIKNLILTGSVHEGTNLKELFLKVDLKWFRQSKIQEDPRIKVLN